MKRLAAMADIEAQKRESERFTRLAAMADIEALSQARHSTFEHCIDHVVVARVESGKAPGLFRALSTLVLNLMTDLVDTVLWALAPRANVPPNHEPLPHELWDCRDPDTPTESGL